MNEENLEETIDEKFEDESTDTTVNSESEIEEVSELEQLQIKLDEAEDKFLRAQAEIANMRNRHAKERTDAAKYQSQSLAKELLTALDNLDRALAIEITGEHAENMKKGIQMVQEGILHAFKAEGIEEIMALGEIFDPTLHQAVQTVDIEEGQQADEIVQVLQKGYKLHDRILRPTMVVVAQ